ncbi:hypothetical protein NKR23_g8642 [Pleurostoma richardsiae]|uniref:Wax synthase domain-containing protein n=1 Tax=Pleurostoma richardsiae TaxID=41990 RepID=A0AA38R5T6_9PEZI|nr:hypothetical protein NKR23_g8642 [Pleurostoma richardsiae]
MAAAIQTPSHPDSDTIYSMRTQDILPHVALPILLIVPLTLRPFPGRGVLFVVLIVITDYACTVSRWPPNAGATRPYKYALAGSWTFVLCAVERLLLHVPERDFRRVDDTKEPRAQVPPELSWAKLRWSAALLATPRAVGWNFGSRGLNARREAMKRSGISRGRFIAARILYAFLAYLAFDAAVVAARTAVVPTGWSWDRSTITEIMYIELLMGVTIYSAMRTQFETIAAISMSLRLSQPEDWPPVFGDITECYTVANVWGKFWHGYIRQPVLGFSHYIVQVLGIPRRSLVAYGIHLATAFLVSGFCHVISLYVVCSGYLSLGELIFDMTVFFMSQPLAAVIETLVIGLYRRSMVCDEGSRDSGLSSRIVAFSQTHPLLQKVTHRLVGYTWVWCWFVLTGWWFVKAYAAMGITEWRMPSIIDMVFKTGS